MNARLLHLQYVSCALLCFLLCLPSAQCSIYKTGSMKLLVFTASDIEMIDINRRCVCFTANNSGVGLL